MSVVYYQVEVSASDLSIFQRNTTESGVSECDLETPATWSPWPSRVVEPW